MKVCSNGHVTKMAAMPICGKNPLKIFSERLTFITAWSNLFPTAFVWEKTLNFIKVIEVYELKVGDFMNYMSTRDQCHCLTFAFKHLLQSYCAYGSQISYGVFLGWGNESICSNGPGHLTSMTAIHVYGETLLKSSPKPTE